MAERPPTEYDPDYMKDENLQYIPQMRELVEDIIQPQHTDLFLYKFLKARDFKVKVAADLFRTYIQWRKNENVDSIIEDYTPTLVLNKYNVNGYHGTSKSGHLVWYERTASIDPKGLLKAVRPMDYRKNFIRETEIMRKIMGNRILETNKPCHQNVQVIDLHGLSMSHLNKPAIDAFSSAIADMEGMYPESLYRLFIIRAPSVFPVAFSMVKGLLPPETQKKITVCAKNYLEVLQEHIDLENIPDFLGGTCKRCLENNGEGCGFRKQDANKEGLYEGIRTGGKIPTTEYLDANLDSWDNVDVKSSKGESIRINVPEAGTTIQYEYSTKDYQLDFSILYNETGEDVPIRDMQIVKEKEKNSTAFVPVFGQHQCEKAGTYILYFVNAHHYTSAKLYYKMEVLADKHKTVVSVSMDQVNEAGSIDRPDEKYSDDMKADTISKLSDSPSETVLMQGTLHAGVIVDDDDTKSVKSFSSVKSKKGDKKLNSQKVWIPRHHVLTDSGRLYTYMGEDSEKITGCHRLDTVVVKESSKVRHVPVGQHGKMFVIELKDETLDRELLLGCEDKEVGKRWIQELSKVCAKPTRRTFLSVRKSMKKSRSQDNLGLDIQASYSEGTEEMPAPKLNRGQSIKAKNNVTINNPAEVNNLASKMSPEKASRDRAESSASGMSTSRGTTDTTTESKEKPKHSRSVISIVCSPLDSLGRNINMDDGKDIVILFLLVLVAVFISYDNIIKQ